MAAITVSLPPWATALRTRLLDEDEEVRLNAVAEVCLLPPITAYPRPRQAANFEIREWRAFAAENGFQEMSQSKHSFQFCHTEYPTLRWGCSTTPGDFRSAMASATDNRNTARLFYGKLLSVMLALMAKPDLFPFKPDFYAIDVPTFGTFVKRVVTDTALFDISMEVTRSMRTKDDNADPAEVRRVLYALQKEFALHPKNSLSQVGVGVESVDRLIMVLSLNDDSQLRVFRDIYTNLVELLESKRDQETQLELDKKRKREVKLAKPLEDAKAAPKPSEVWVTMGTNLREGVLNRVRRANEQMVRQLALHGDELLKEVDSGLLLPPLPDGIDEVAELRQQAFLAQDELRQMKEQLATHNKVVKELDELHQLMKSSDETDPWRQRLKGFLSFLKEKKLDQDHGPRALTKILDDVMARMDAEIEAVEKKS